MEKEKQIKKLGIPELEERIKAQEIESVFCRENIYEGYNQVRQLNRVWAVNEKIV